MTETAAPRRRNRRPKFDDATIANLKRGAKAERKPDPQCPPNHYFRIPAAGSNAPGMATVSFALRSGLAGLPAFTCFKSMGNIINDCERFRLSVP